MQPASGTQYDELAMLSRQLRQCATAAIKQPQAGAVLQVLHRAQQHALGT